jgi:hypothetical protein
MVVKQWCEVLAAAHAAERGLIQDCLKQELPLLNFEAELQGRQQSRTERKPRKKRPTRH